LRLISLSRRRWAGWTGAAVALICCFTILYRATPARWLTLHGEAFLAQGRYTRGLAQYEQAALLNPVDPSLRVRLARLYAAKQNFSVAKAHLEQAVRLDPQYLPALILAAEISQREDPGAGLIAWQDVLAVDATNKVARHGLGECLVALAHFDAAEEVYASLAGEEPEDDSALLALGQLESISQPEAALTHLRLVAKGKDQNLAAQAAELLSTMEQAQGESDLAYAAALIGSALLRLDQPALAQAAFAQAVRCRPDYYDALAYEALAIQERGQNGPAEALLRGLLREVPDHPLSHYVLALTLRAQARLPEAVEEFRRVIALSGDDPTLLSDLGQTYAMAGDVAEAEEQFRRAASLRPGGFQEVLTLAHFYLDRGFRVDRGLEAASVAVALRPDDAEALDLLGWALHLNGRSAEAKVTLEEALKRAPDLPAAFYHLGVVLEKMGDRRGAAAAYERAVDLANAGPILEHALNAQRSLVR